MGGQTAIEKIFSQAVGREVTAGEIILAPIDLVYAQDGTAPLAIKVMREEFGVEKVFNPKKVAFFIDHISPSSNIGTSELHMLMREFAEKHGIMLFDVGVGISHQVVAESGYAVPGAIIVGADSHTVTHGAFGAFSTGVGSTDAAVAMIEGKLWFKVPESMKITVEGELKRGVMSKDLILHIIGDLRADGATYMSVEFHGPAIEKLSVSSRMTITNMVVEMGGKNGYIPPDEKTLKFLEGRAKKPFKPVHPDSDAHYADEITYDAREVEPVVAAPHTVDNVKAVAEVEGQEVNQVFIGSCTNGRVEDLEVAARILKGKKVKDGVRCIVIPASRQVFLEALKLGYIDVLTRAGCMVAYGTCGPCVGAHFGILGPGEVEVATSNRNFRGRAGHRDSLIFLASPATAAAAAVAGKIVDPREYL